jgi:heme/copper-type cytochrome/quinol oxidase subunit 2
MRASSSKRLARLAACATLAYGFRLAAAQAAAQCAMCSGAADASAGQFAFSKSTLMMLSVPYLLLGGVALYVVRAFRRSRDDSGGTPTDGDSAGR